MDILRTVRRRWVLVLSCTILCLGVAAYHVVTAPLVYRAGAVVRLQDTQKTLTGMADATEPTLGNKIDPLLSLLEVMRSEIVLGDAIDRSALRLREVATGAPPVFLQQVEISTDAPLDTLRFRFAERGFQITHAAGEVTAAYGIPVELPGLRFTVSARPRRRSAELYVVARGSALSGLRAGLVARQRGLTNVVEVLFSADNPVLAQVSANEVVEAFQRNSVRMSQDQSQRRRVFLEEQLKAAEEAQGEAQLALSRFRSREQLFSSQARMAAEQSGLMGVEVRREELLAERDFYGSILSELGRSDTDTRNSIGTLVGSPTITTNPVVSSLLQQLMRYESTREELTTGETGVRADHPDVQRVQTLIATTQERLLGAVRSHVEVLNSRIASLNRLEARGSQQMRQLSDTEAEEVRLVQRADAAERLTRTLEGELQKAKIAEAVEAGQVEILERARIPSGPVANTSSYQTLLMGLMAGLLLGAGSAFAVEHLNTSLRREEELETLLHVPGLAVIPRIVLNGTAPRRLLSFKGIRAVVGRAPADTARGVVQAASETAVPVTSAGAEAFRTLRTNLIFSPAVNRLKSAVVTSAAPREGKSTTAANLAVACAQQGMSVLLLDADLRRPRQHEVFNLPQSPGLADVLLGEVSLTDAIRSTPVQGLSVLTAGTRTVNAAELVGGKWMQQLLTTLREQFDLILIDTPPLLAVADAAILSLNVDGTIVVVQAGKTDRDAAVAAVQKLNAVGARVVGAVLNDPDARIRQYKPYYDYSYDYTAAPS